MLGAIGGTKKMNTRTGLVAKKIVALVLAIAVACPYTYAADVGKVTYIEGRVDVSKEGSDLATPLREGDPIAIGDAVRTKSNSKAEITFNDKSALRLAQNTRIEVKDYVLDAENRRKTADIMVDRGKIRTIIEKMPGLTEFNISTPNAKGTVHGSDVFTSFQAGSSSMLVAEGQLSILNPVIPKEVIIIPAGSSVVVPPNEAPKGPRAYFDLEKQMQEQDTSIPQTVSRDPNSTVIKGVIGKMSGDVRVKFKNTGEVRKATVNDILSEGDTIETGKDGLVEINFDNGNGLNLKEETSVTITKLAQDPKTGQYENKFDAKMGKVRARIEKLKETNSTFEVRTPTAICGARGTLMYVEIGPRTTRCFFEGGLGDLASAISNMHRQIEMGHAAYSDNDGNVFEQYIPSDEERLDWTSNWDPGNGTEGYAGPGSTVGVTLGDGGITGGIVIPPNGMQDFFNDPLFPVTGEEEEEVEEVTSSGSFHGDSSYYGNGNGKIDGIVAIINTFWNGGTATIESAGTYDTYGYSPFVWFGEYNYEQYAVVEGETVNEGFLYSYNPETQTYTTYDGGAFYGNAVGIGGGSILDGMARLLYIDASGNAGIVKGFLEGLYALGTYIVVGELVGQQMATDIGIAAEDLYNSIFITDYCNGALYGVANSGGASTGSISGNDRFNTFSIINNETGVAQNWGIYQHIFSGSSYSGDLSSGWTGHMGGNDAIGAYFRIYEDEGEGIRAMVSEDDGGASGYFNQDSGYWFMNISNGTWADNNFSADASGFFITMTKMGTMSGDLLGVYNDEGSWQGVGMGEWSGTPLKFASEVYGSTYYPRAYASGQYYYYDGDNNTIGYYSYNWNDYYYYYYYGYQIGSTYYEDQANHTYTYTYYYGDGTYRVDVYDTTDGNWTLTSQTYGNWDREDIESLILTPPGSGAVLESEYYSADRQHNGHVYGIFGGTDSLWGIAPAAAVFLARYEDCSNYNTDKGAWTSSFGTKDRIHDRSTDYEGGAYYGLFSAAYTGSRAIGIFKAFYVDPNGGAGIMDGNFTGTNYTDINMIRLDGSIVRDGRFPGGIGVAPEDLDDHISSGGGDGTLVSDTDNDWVVRGQEELNTMSLVDYDEGTASDWGIYAQNFTGYYNGAVPQGWSAIMGGNDSFGITDPYMYGENADYSYSDGEYYYYFYTDNSYAYQYYYRENGEKYYTYYYSNGTTETYNYNTGWSYGVWRVNGNESLADIMRIVPDSSNATENYVNPWTTYDSDYGYWIADISEGTWADGNLSATLNGRYISRTRLGTMNGLIRGLYDEFGNNGSWVGVGAGEWEGEDLSWVSNLGVSRHYYYYDYNNALMGSVDDLWSGTPRVVGMGNINNYEASYRIWGSDNVYTHNYMTDNDTAYSGGAFYGLLRGIVLDDESLKGLFRAIYIDQSGNGGVMRGFIDDGQMYQDLGMFEFAGSITDRMQKVSSELLNVNDENLIEYVRLNNNDAGYLYGAAEDGSYLYGSDNFRTMSIADYDQGVAQNWGIYGQAFSGGSYYDNGALSAGWTGHMGGNDSFGVYSPTINYNGWYSTYNNWYDGDEVYHYTSRSYSYDYDKNNQRGVGYYSRYEQVGDSYTVNINYYTYYYGDGTWKKIDNNTGLLLETGTWDPVNQDLEDILRYPSDLGEWGWYSSGHYSNIKYGSDYGYWLAEVETDPDWAIEGSFHAGLEGRFLTYTRTGTLNGEILGRLLSDGSWQGVGAGDWEGQDLSSAATVNNGWGYFYGLMGTTGDIWSANTTPASMVLMGYYSGYGDYEDYCYYNMFRGDAVYSHNWKDETNTTYTNPRGSYYGFIRGVTDKLGDMAGWFKALYIDSNGNAGIMDGDITSGEIYTDIDMFVADGVINALTQKAENVGILPSDIATSVTTGSCSSGDVYGSGAGWYIDGGDGMQSYTLVNYTTGVAQMWGIYAQNLSGYYEGTVSNGWSANIVSSGGFGGYSPAMYKYGTYSYYYSDYGHYDYNYYTDDSYGYGYYYRPSTGEHYYTYYYGDGTYKKYDYNTESYTYGNWLIEHSDLDFLATPPDTTTGYWSSGPSSYNTVSSDEGYYFGKLSNGTWENNYFTADYSARFMTYTKMGEMSGPVRGMYDNDGSWYGVGIGNWEGEPLSHVSQINAEYEYSEITGYSWYGYPYYVHHYSDVEALMGGVDSLWSSDPDITIMGQVYYYNRTEPFIWEDTNVHSHNFLIDRGYGDGDGDGDGETGRANVTYDGGSYSGSIIGIFGGDIIKAAFAALYIDNEGNAGAFKADFSGEVFAEGDSYYNYHYFVIDNTTFDRSGNSYEVDINPGDLQDYLYTTTEGTGTLVGNFVVTEDGETYTYGSISGSDTLTTTTIADADLGIALPIGIYNQALSGSFSGIEGSADFEAIMGGYDPIGAYIYSYTYEGDVELLSVETEEFNIGDDWGYWLAEVGGSVTSDSTIEAVLDGLFLTYTKIGRMFGSILGTHNGSSWEGRGVGILDGEDLSFASDIEIDDDIWISAIMGGVGSIVSGPADITLLGQYEDYGDNWYYDAYSEEYVYLPYTWTGESQITSYNIKNDSDTTYDGGAYYGVMGGLVRGENISADFAALFVDKDGNAGYVLSSLFGTLYSSLGMLYMDGETDWVLKSKVGFAASDLADNIVWTGGEGQMSGQFTNGIGLTSGYIYANDYFDTMSIADYANAKPEMWGIYTQYIDGYKNNPDGFGMWTSKMGGEDAFGASSAYRQSVGEYYYLNGDGNYDGSYYYDTRTTGEGYVSYYRYTPDENGNYGYSINFNADGSFTGTLYTVEGNFEITELPASFIGMTTPEDAANAYCNYEYSYDNYNSDDGFWIADINGTDDGEGVIRGNLLGRFLTGTKMGTLSGSVTGTYNPYSEGEVYWSGYGLGTWVGEELTFSGMWNPEEMYYGKPNSLYMNYGGYTYNIGEEYGLIGAVVAPWSGSGSMTVMGGYYTYDGDGSYVWNSPIVSYDVRNDTYTTLDGGAFFGFSAGLWKDGDVKGSVYGVYIDPDKNIGYLTGGILGSYYSDLGMWEAVGTLSAFQKLLASGSDPADFTESLAYMSLEDIGFGINYDYSEAEFSGWFNGDGYIYGYIGTEQLMAVDQARMGVFSLMFDYENYYYRTNDTNTTWGIAVGGSDYYDDQQSYWYMGVTGNWYSDGTLDGIVKGARISETTLTTLIGDLYGTHDDYEIYEDYDPDTGERVYYNEYGSWIGSAVGYAEEVDLAWSARTEAQFNYFDYYGDEVIYYDDYSYADGIMGSLISPFANAGNATPVVIIGEADGGYGMSAAAWGRISGSFAGDGSRIPDGFIGAAVSMANVMKGIIAALYIDEAGIAGTLLGAFTGHVIPNGSIWQAEGTITATPYASGFGEEYLTNNNYIDGSATGTFGAEGTIEMPYNIYDMSYGSLMSYTACFKDPVTGDPLNWGIYNIELGGYFTGATSDNWNMALSGNSWQEADMFWVAGIKGDKWSEGLVSGDMKGIWLKEGADGKIMAGSIQGKVVGSEYVEVEGETGTWQAISAGEWVEVTDLLDKTAMGLGNNLEELNRFVNVPITQVYSNLLNQVGAGSITSGVTVQSLNDFLNFAFALWQNNQWVADYNGRANGVDIAGQAGGTYANGTYGGVGAGINQDILNTVNVTGNYAADGTITNTVADVALYTNTVTPPVVPPTGTPE